MNVPIWRRIAATTLLIAATVAAPLVAHAAAPPLRWLGGGTTGVTSVAVSRDGATVATASGADNTVKLWDTGSGRLRHTLAAHPGGVSSVAFTPDGTGLVSGGEFVFGSTEPNVILWRASDGAFLHGFKVPGSSGAANAVAVSPDGTLVAVGHAGGQVGLYRLADGALVRTLTGHSAGVLSVAFSPDGALVASGSADNTARVWRVADGRAVRTLTGHTFLVDAVAFSPDGTLLATGSLDKTVRLWRTTDFGTAAVLRHPDQVDAVAFNADGTALAAGQSDTDTQLWQVRTARALRTLPGSGKSLVSSVTFKGLDTVLTGSFDGHVRLWNAADGRQRAILGEHFGAVDTVAFSPDCALLASGSDDTSVKLWRTTDGSVTRTLTTHTDVVNAVAFGRTLLATAAGSPPPFTTDTTISLISATDGTTLRTLPGHAGGTTGAALTADERVLISTGRDHALRFWNTADGTALRTVTAGTPGPILAISPDRTTVAAGGSGTLSLYSTADGTLLRTFTAPLPNLTSLSFSGDGALLAAGGDAIGNNVTVFRVADGSVLRTLDAEPATFVQGVAFAPTGTTLATSSGFTHVIRLWDAATGTLLRTYDRETGWGPTPRLPVAFAPDGTALAWGRGDATVALAAT
jgi:WD40 repeat protein